MRYILKKYLEYNSNAMLNSTLPFKFKILQASWTFIYGCLHTKLKDRYSTTGQNKLQTTQEHSYLPQWASPQAEGLEDKDNKTWNLRNFTPGFFHHSCDVLKLNLESKKLHRASLKLCLVDVTRKIICPGQLQNIMMEDARY